tara:strand:+ start:1578 stop:2411 length:834 start_codon:yes stop_codon:yes gene_type:complete
MFKQFTEENVNLYDFKSNKNYRKNQSQIIRYNFVSGSSDETLSRNYNFARINLYLSGSDYSQTNKKYNSYPTAGNRLNQDKMFFDKFYVSGSVLSIPQNEFGDRIKPGTFTLTDNSTATEITIVDDLNGNLYAPSAPSSSNPNLSLSSSANYVGNIFYELGVFTIVETGSHDGTNNYSEVTSGNYNINYKGVYDLTTYEYVCTALPNEMNQTQNMSIFSAGGQGKLKDHLTGSLFPTYVTEVGLYDDNEDLIGIARLSKPIPKSRKIPMRFFVRMDY